MFTEHFRTNIDHSILYHVWESLILGDMLFLHWFFHRGVSCELRSLVVLNPALTCRT